MTRFYYLVGSFSLSLSAFSTETTARAFSTSSFHGSTEQHHKHFRLNNLTCYIWFCPVYQKCVSVWNYTVPSYSIPCEVILYNNAYKYDQLTTSTFTQSARNAVAAVVSAVALL